MCVPHWILFLFLLLGVLCCSAVDERGESSSLDDEVDDDDDESTFLFTPTERAFLQIPDAQRARSSLKILTSVPHVAGTKGDRQLAEFVRQQFLDAGIPRVSIEDLVVKLNYPDLESHEPSASLSLWEEIALDDKENDKENENEIQENTYLRKPSETTKLSTGNLVLEEEHLLRRNKKNTTADTYHLPKRKQVFRASLSEDLLDPEIDPTTDTIWRNHTFHGYSPSGNLSHTRFVYANYGRPQDFAVLESAGISVKNKIVLMRYGECFRGLKVRNAQTRGALGAILYSDPADDGDSLGEVYPNGPWRPASGVQRGSVQFNSKCGGDPYRADPRYKSVFDTSVEELCNITDPSSELVPSIPSIPIGYGDAIPLLQNLGGVPAADIPGADDFIGGIKSVTYRIGPSKGHLDMVVRNTDKTTKVPNVVGIIPGSLPPELDQPVLLGNHRDAWVYGAADPNSGTSSLLELARGFGNLYQNQNWRPLRSIYLLSWSGEEYGLLGSTGWGELNMMVPKGNEESVPTSSSLLLRRSLAYLNADTIVSGDHLKVSASPSLFSLWKGVISDLQRRQELYEGTITSVTRFLQNVSMVDANSAREISTEEESGDDIGVLGSGSDYTVFLDHFGIPSLDFSYSNSKAHYGQYHSIYDSFAWMDKFGGGGNDDKEGTSFELMAFAAKLWGLLALRLADSTIVPVDHVSQGSALKRYTSHLQDEIAKIDTTIFDFDIVDLTKAIESYAKNAAQLQLYCSKASANLSKSSNPSVEWKEQVQVCNEKLGLTERFLLLEEGLPERPWFKHCLQAPGLDLGYAAESFPGIQQALDDQRYALAQEQIDLAAERITAAANNLVVEAPSKF